MKKIKVSFFTVAILWLITCSFKKNKESVEECIRHKTAKCITNSIKTLKKKRSPVISEFYNVKSKNVYYYLCAYPTDIDRFLNSGFSTSTMRFWTLVDDDFLAKPSKYRLSLIKDSSEKENLNALTVYVYEPLKTDSCYYVSSRLYLEKTDAYYTEYFVCKFTLTGDLLMYYTYAAVM